MKKQTNEDLLKIINEDITNFFATYGRYPTFKDMSSSGFRISVKTIHRRYGGLKNLRGLLNLPIIDYSTTNGKPKYLQTFVELENTLHQKVLNILNEKFHPSNIHNFFVKNKTKDFHIEIIYVDTEESFFNIFNIRQHKKYIQLHHEDIIYIVEGIDIKKIMENKKHRLQPNTFVIPLEDLPNLINNYIPFSVI